MDNRFVWHCDNHRRGPCVRHQSCKGTKCSDYTAIYDSYHSYVENDPIKGYLDNNKKPIRKGVK